MDEEEICEFCSEITWLCDCPECPVCGDFGNPDCSDLCLSDEELL